MHASRTIPTLAAVVSLAAVSAPVANAYKLAPLGKSHANVLAAPQHASSTHRRKDARQPQIHKELQISNTPDPQDWTVKPRRSTR
jgi:predicted HAD superfamily Cof-like phosphohydrolase